MAGKNVRIQPIAPDVPNYRLLGMATANPLEDAMQRLEKIGEAAGSMAGSLEGEADVFEGKNPEMLLPLSPAAVAYNRAAGEAYSVKVEGAIKTKVAELGSRFDGRKTSDPESFAQMFDASADEILQSVPQSMRARVGVELGTRRSLAVAEIGDRARKYELERSIATVKLGLQSDTEEAAVLARDGMDESLVEAVRSRAAGRVQSMVADGVWSEEEGAIRLDEIYGDIEAERVFGAASRSGSLQAAYRDAITGGKSVANLSLTQRDRLATKLSAEMGRRESAASHARAEHAAAVKKNTYLARVIAEQRRFGVEPVGEMAKIEGELASGAREADAGAIVDLNRQRGIMHFNELVVESPPAEADMIAADIRRRATLGEIDGGVAKEIDSLADQHRAGIVGEDPTGYLADKGLLRAPGAVGPYQPGAEPTIGPRIPPPPVTFDRGFAGSMTDRVARLELAEQKYGKTFPSLTKSEAQELKARLDMASAKERVELLGTLVGIEGTERSKKTLRLLADTGATNYALIGSLASRGMTAQALAVADTDFIDPKDRKALLKPEGGSATYEADFNAEVGDLFVGTGLGDKSDKGAASDRQLLKEASIALYTSSAYPAKAYDSNVFRQKVREVLEGRKQTVQFGGYWNARQTTIVAPRDENGQVIDVQGVVDRLGPADLATMGGTGLKGSLDQQAQFIRENASRLIPAGGDGLFHIYAELGDGTKGYVTRPDGNGYFVLDVRKARKQRFSLRDDRTSVLDSETGEVLTPTLSTYGGR